MTKNTNNKFKSLLLGASLAWCVGTAHAQQSPELLATEATAYLQKNHLAMGLESSDISEIYVSSAHKDARTGTTYVYLGQRINGIPVHNAIANFAILRSGKVVVSGNTLVQGVSKRQAESARLISGGIGAADALQAAARHAGVSLLEAPRTVSSARTGSHKHVFAAGKTAAEDMKVELAYVRNQYGDLVLSWNAGIYTANQEHFWDVFVDVRDGSLVNKHDQVVHDHFGTPGHPEEGPREEAKKEAKSVRRSVASVADGSSYFVLPFPAESPNHGSLVTVSEPADATASPFGWHDTNGAAGAEYTITRGNNVHAYEDSGNNNASTGNEPNGGSGLDFLTAPNFTLEPSTYKGPATTNLFFVSNQFHDIMYHYGFDEASGNFQENNYGRGGAGNDAVNAEAQDGSGTNNANFFTPADGSKPRMQMYNWTQTTPGRDGDYDNGIIAHEYGHGVSIRLTGGANNVSCLNNNEQMGEGWSDFFGIILSMDASDVGTENRGVGTYALGQATNGTGIRPAPYNTNMTVNGYTYGDINGLAIPHGVGFLWCTMIWDMNWLFIDRYGFDPDMTNGTGGNNKALELVMEGLKLQPCSPGFVDGRNAILLADQNLNGGANQDIIWEAFARRGLGFSASQGSSGSTTDGTEAFDVPGPNMSISGVSPSPIFSVGTGTLADMTGATTLLGTGQDDANSALANIGFTFDWTGGSYTTFGVSSNGFIRLGAASTGTPFNNSTNFPGANSPMIAPFYDDMHTGADGNVRYKLIGTSPNQTLVVEWNVRPWISGSSAVADRTYQAWLNEDGTVNFVYGAIPTTTNNGGYTIGYANSASEFVCVTTASGTASSTTTNHTQTNAIAAGTMYTLGGIADRFIFATEAGTPSAADSLIVGGTLLTADITVTAPANFEVSTDGVNYSGSLALTQVGGTVANTMVYVRIAASAAVGSVGGDVVCSSTGAVNKTQAVTGTVTADVTAPSIELVSSAGSTTDMPFTVFFNFSEPVTGFTPADITVTNASLSNAAVVSPSSYSMYVTPRGTGMVTLFVGANKAQDAAGNQNTASNTLMVDYTGIPLGYCMSSGDLVGEDWLKRVEIFGGTIGAPDMLLNNFSGRNGGYFNFADSVVAPNLLQGMTYNIRISPGRNDLTRQEAYKTWVDWNQDGDYADAGELVYSRNLTDLPAVRSTFVVPATASVGYTMMRVQMKQGQVPFASCENFSRGEVEDYKINVQAPAARTATPASLSRTAAGEVETGVMALFPNPAQQQVTVQFRFNESVDATVEVYDLQGRAVRSLQFAQTRVVDANIEVAGLPQGLYLVKVMGTDGTISTQKLSVK